MNTLISVVMPICNCASTLEVAVRSIERQTCCDWELLIIDDGSKDDGVNIARGLVNAKVKLIADGRGNMGLSARLNQGIAMARGRYIARMDGDDVSFPERLERELDYLERHPGVDLVGCGMVIFRDAGEMVGVQIARRTHAEICGNAIRSCLLPHATWMGRAGWFCRHPYSEGTRRAEDRELLLRTRDCSRFAGIPEPMYGYRVNQVSIRKNARARYEYTKALMVDARRRADWRRMIGASVAEAGKLAIDTFALATHTDGILLRHRARRPTDSTIASRWAETWNSLQGASS